MLWSIKDQQRLPQKVVVIGTCCSGKTTLAKKISGITNAPHIELDSLFWQPGWIESELAYFRERVEAILTTEKWVVDGNYSAVRDLIWPRADTVVWLDLPLSVLLKRCIVRCFSRAFRKTVLWNGCRETLRETLFQKNSMPSWVLKTNKKNRIKFASLMNDPCCRNLKFHHLCSTRAVDDFVESLRTFVLDEGKVGDV